MKSKPQAWTQSGEQPANRLQPRRGGRKNSLRLRALKADLKCQGCIASLTKALVWKIKSMSNLAAELREIFENLMSMTSVFDKPEIIKPLEALENSANDVGKAWSGSWFGYHSRVYYTGLEPPPPGAHFSSEWGLQYHVGMGSTGEWEEFGPDVVETEIRKRAGNPDLSQALKVSNEARLLIEQKRDDVVSILRTAKGRHDDQFLGKLIEDAEKVKIFSEADFVVYFRPSGKLWSRDTVAIGQGLWTPPHISILVEVLSIGSPKLAYESLIKIARLAFSHLERSEKNKAYNDRVGTNVFIGHGRSKEWKDLKDFINDRMRLPWDEFNRVPVAGVPNTVRLLTMLDAAAIAFLVLTAEDERADGKMQARMNVIHEAGLFQGRLGFTRAIIMLEDGCEEFSNIAGLGQIRFPNCNIKAAFHDVQLILEREGLIEPPESPSVFTLQSSANS